MNKGLEEIRNPIGCEFTISRKKYVYSEEQVEIIEKELKILELLTKEVVPVVTKEYRLSDGTSEYVLRYDIIYGRSITKEQFDLLKEAGI